MLDQQERAAKALLAVRGMRVPVIAAVNGAAAGEGLSLALAIDGVEERISGWYGQRDRSRGVRTMSGGQGPHIWYQAQFPDRSIGFLLVENRAGGRLLLEGAVMHTDGGLDPVVDVRHDLKFDQFDLRSGTVEVATEAGRVNTIETDTSAGGR